METLTRLKNTDMMALETWHFPLYSVEFDAGMWVSDVDDRIAVSLTLTPYKSVLTGWNIILISRSKRKTGHEII